MHKSNAQQRVKSHVVHIITGLQRGGAETVLVTLCAELARSGYRQTVIYFRDGVLRHDLAKLGIATHQANYFTLFTRMRALQPDVIHSSLWSANLLARIYAKLLKIPVYCALHTVAEHSGFLRNFIDKLVPIQPQNYIAVSQTVKDSYTHILPARTITVIENGISPTPCTLSVSPQGKCIEGRAYTIGAVGRFVPVKNFNILLQAFAQIHKEFPHTHLMLIGHGPLEHQLRIQAEQLQLQQAVTFVINKPAREYYPHFDCFVQPSAHEGLSIALLEALQARLPVIVTGENNQHAVVQDALTGLIIESNSTNALYSALKYYILNSETAQKHAAAGSEYVQEHFSAHAMARKYDTLFKQE